NVSIKYSGWLENNNKVGSSFDSNISSGTQFRFEVGVGRVIKGWDLGVIGMRKGIKRVLAIPSELGYGEKENSSIPSGSNLIFEIEVTGSKRKESSE
ncbi:hypothetical protein DICPUDRAFT_13138, partial [Dictyostelium purpureum]